MTVSSADPSPPLYPSSSKPSQPPSDTTDLPPDPGPQNETPPALPEEPLTVWNQGLIIFVLTFIITIIALSPKWYYTALFVLLAFLPAFPFMRYIRHYFQDPAVSRSFLVSQLLIAAIPLVLLASQIEWILSAIFGFIIFNSEYGRVASALDALDTANTAAADGDDDFTALVIQTLSGILPLWKILLFFCLVAFLTAGAVEEIGKWIVARRYKRIEPEEAADDSIDVPRIGCRGILASFCMTALGFAAAENVLFVLGVAQANRNGFSFGMVGVVLLRGILAYPVHIGSQFYIGVAEAQRHVFKDPTSVWMSVFVAVLFHGLFDVVSFVFLILVTLDILPSWTASVVPVFDLVLIGFLLLLCRGRHKALLEREKMVFPQNPV